MTREEAIYRLKNMAWLYGSAEREQNIEAIDMAMKSLQADADVVRCKDCKHLKTMCEDEGTCYYWCKHWNNATDDWGHCYYGERRDL